jgi:hypothetical protein
MGYIWRKYGVTGKKKYIYIYLYLYGVAKRAVESHCLTCLKKNTKRNQIQSHKSAEIVQEQSFYCIVMEPLAMSLRASTGLDASTGIDLGGWG